MLVKTVSARTRELRRANRMLRRQATADARTGVHNQCVFGLATKEFNRSRRAGTPFMQRVLKGVSANPFFSMDQHSVVVTVSIGCTVLWPEDADISAALQRADNALLLAKQRGRNRVEFL